MENKKRLCKILNVVFWVSASLALLSTIVVLSFETIKDVARQFMAFSFIAWITFAFWRRGARSAVEDLRDGIDYSKLRLAGIMETSDLDPASKWSSSEWKQLVLPRQIQKLGRTRIRNKFWLYAANLLTFMLVSGALFVSLFKPKAQDFFGGIDTGTLVIGFLFYTIFTILWALSRYNNIKYLNNEIRSKQVDLELSQYSGTAEEERADKLFRLNQLDLRDYYQLNLRQNQIAFLIGISCIVASLGVVAATMFLLQLEDIKDPKDTKWLIAGIGAVSTIMVNVVAAIFLRMQASAGQSLNKFHERLVATSDLFLSNLIVARIDEEKLKRETLAKMALSIANIRETMALETRGGPNLSLGK